MVRFWCSGRKPLSHRQVVAATADLILAENAGKAVAGDPLKRKRTSFVDRMSAPEEPAARAEDAGGGTTAHARVLRLGCVIVG
jgi:hypothetical protein